MHQLAVREAVPNLTRADLALMSAANRRFRTALRDGDVEAALRADDELHGVLVTVAAMAANRAVATVLDQFTPVLRRLSGCASRPWRARARSRGTTI